MDRQAPLNPGSILDTGNVGQGPAAMEVESGSAGDNGLEPDVQIKQEQVHFTTGRPFEPLEVIVIPDDDEDGDFDMSMIPFMEAAAMEALYRPADGDDELELATNDGQANEPLDQTQAGPARNAQFTGPQATAAQPVPIPVDTERLGRFRDRIAAESKPSATVGGLNFPEGALDHVLVTKKENRGWQPTIKVLLDHVYAWQFPFPEALLASNDPQAVIVVYMRTCQGRDLTIELHIRLMLEVARRLPRSIKLVFAPVCDSQTIDVFCRENDRVVDDLKPEVSLVLSVDDACHNMASGSSLVVFPLLMTHPDGRAGLLLSRNRVGVKDIFAQSVAFQIYDKMKETYPTVRGIKACIDDDDSRTPESIISQVIPILWDPRVFTVPGIQGGVLARPHGPTIIRNIRPQNEFDGLQNSGMIAVPMTEMTRKICFGNFKRPRGDAVDWIYMLNLQMNTKNGTGLVLVVVLMLCHYYSSRMIDNRTKESLNIWNGRLVLGVGEGPKYRTVQATLPPGLTGPHVALAREVLKHGNLLSYCDEVCQRWAAAIIPDGQEQRPWPGSANLFLGLVEEILKMEFEMGASFLFAKGYGCFRRMRNRFGTNKEANEDLLRPPGTSPSYHLSPSNPE
ncbi:hypothetical protein DFJ74DRAFT_645635 [Hyaloraphidium curvatum]|nr:hypothetical protein DFJ74DRAFT_645635 [Hyaloraphidium curvatum]